MLIKRKEISSFGLEELNNIDTDTHAKTQIKKALLCYKFQPHYPDDDYGWLTCVLALKSVCKNNFGVGALLADSNGDITEFGHNEVFHHILAVTVTPKWLSCLNLKRIIKIWKRQGLFVYIPLWNHALCV